MPNNRKNGDNSPSFDWNEIGADLRTRAGVLKETPLETFVRLFPDVIQTAQKQGHTIKDLCDWLTEKGVPGAYPKSLNAAIKKLKNPGLSLDQLFLELTTEFSLAEPEESLTLEQPYLLKGKEACKIVVFHEELPDGKVQFQILNEANSEKRTVKLETLLKNLRGPIAQEFVTAIAAKL